MSDKELVTQCAMTDENGREHVAFIPKMLAKKGNRVTIDGMDGTWTVTATYASMHCSEANERSRDHARQREFSDA